MKDMEKHANNLQAVSEGRGHVLGIGILNGLAAIGLVDWLVPRYPYLTVAGRDVLKRAKEQR